MTLRQYDLVVGVETDDLSNVGVIANVLVSTKSADYTITDTDNIGTLLVDDTSSDRTITLPTAADNTDRTLLIQNTSSDGGKVIVDGEGAETINGQTTVTLYSKYDKVRIQCNGTEWFILDEIPPQEITTGFDTVSNVGSANQIYAGHIWGSDEAGTGTDIAYYKFASGALTTDEEGTYTLTNNNTVTNTTGIDGADFAANFNGTNQYFSNGTFLDTSPAAIVVDFWFLADDGQPASAQYFMDKINVTASDYMSIILNTVGEVRFTTEASAGGSNQLDSLTQAPNGAMTDWIYVVCAWDATYGKRLFINGVLENRRTTATGLMGNGTQSDFTIGASSTPGNYYDGKISLFRIRNKVITQKDVDQGYSVRWNKPAIFEDQQYKLNAHIRKDGSTDYEREYDINSKVVAQNDSYIYTAGGIITGLGSTDTLRLRAKGV